MILHGLTASAVVPGQRWQRRAGCAIMSG